jgi:hypothetical protein
VCTRRCKSRDHRDDHQHRLRVILRIVLLVQLRTCDVKLWVLPKGRVLEWLDPLLVSVVCAVCAEPLALVQNNSLALRNFQTGAAGSFLGGVRDGDHRSSGTQRSIQVKQLVQLRTCDVKLGIWLWVFPKGSVLE